MSEPVESVLKAVRVLEHLGEASDGLGARELAQWMGEPKSTVQRLLQTLEVCQMVAQDPVSQRYQLGPRTLQLGMVCLRRVDVRRAALPVMHALRDATGETVGLNIRVGDARMYIEQVESPHQLKAKAELGAPYALHTGSPGRVLLAFLPQAEIERILDGARLDPRTDEAPRTKAEILDRLASIREQGSAVAFGETIVGLNTIAAPVRNHLGEVAAALSVSGPAARFGPEQMDEVRTRLLAAAAEVSLTLGYREPGRADPLAPAETARPTATARRRAGSANAREIGP